MDVGVDYRQIIARRAAQEIQHGMIVNLGIGIPTLVADYLSPDIQVMFHAENGILGSGPSPEAGQENPMLCNAGGFPVTVVPGASYFDSTVAFGIIRRGLLDMTILGALEVSEKGDLANWIVPGKRVPGMGGAIDLAQKSKKVIITTRHNNKDGSPKIVKSCSLPLTAPRCVDMVITEKAVLEVCEDGLLLKEVHQDFSVDEVKQATGAPLKVPDHVEVFQ
ncbi:MAG: CoA transferase subunit B [Bacillaceae bacterium]|nr:CoA transferase subunit B [Bacillaceae bacterium]